MLCWLCQLVPVVPFRSWPTNAHTSTWLSPPPPVACSHRVITARVALRGSHRCRRRAPRTNKGTPRCRALPMGALPLQGHTCMPSMFGLRTCLSLLWPSRPDAAVVVVVPATVQGGGGLASCATGVSARVNTLVVRCTLPDRCVVVGMCNRTYVVATGVTTRQETHA